MLVDIQALLANLYWFSIYYIRRDANSVSHVLARYVKHFFFFMDRGFSSLCYGDFVFWFGSFTIINDNLVRFPKKNNNNSVQNWDCWVERTLFLHAQHQQPINPFIYFILFVFSSPLSFSAWPQVKFTLFTPLLVLPNTTPPIFISPSIHPHGHGLDKLKWKWANK